MGLAGPRKRTKISHDPNNTNWSRSTNNFGHKILTAQGWTPGTYLGAKNAPHAQFHSAASASHIRIALKDDNLGLGAKRGSGQVEGECTGLSAFQGLLGRLNGKTEEEVDKERKSREDVRREIYMENRWGSIKFVKGGLLVGDKIREEPADDETGRPQEPTAPMGRTAEGTAGNEEYSEGKGRRKVEKQSDECGDSRQRSADKPDKAQAGEKEVKSKEDKEKKKNRRLERRGRRSTKRQIAKEQVAAGKMEECSEQSPSAQDPLLKAVAIDSAEPERANASSSMSTGMLSRGRHVVRQRYIQQKKMALLDMQALNEIPSLHHKSKTTFQSFIQTSTLQSLRTLSNMDELKESLESSGLSTSISSDANLLSAITGLPPVASVRNVAWEHQENRLARFEGFPKQIKLVGLKQRTVDEAEYDISGCGPGNRGWGVSWYPFVNTEPDLKGLLNRLEGCRRRLPANSYANGAALKQLVTPYDNTHPWVTGADPLVFDTVLVSPPPSEVSTEALRDLPIRELTTKPAFCFLWVRDSSEIELCSDIMQEWGFRTVERLAYFGLIKPTKSPTHKLQEEAELLDLPGEMLLPLLKDLGFPNGSPDFGLSVEDFLRFTPLKSGSESATPPYCVTANAWGAGGRRNARGCLNTDNPPEQSTLFDRTTRFCLIGMNGKMKRSTDGHIVHSNIDPDVIISAGKSPQITFPHHYPANTSRAYFSDEARIDCVGLPPLIYDVIENLALGRRRLHIFANEASMRRGWVSVGPEILETNFNIEDWESVAKELGWLVKFDQEIEDLRPKSPPAQQGRDGNGRCWQTERSTWRSTGTGLPGPEDSQLQLNAAAFEYADSKTDAREGFGWAREYALL
ncbi:hypothetical protein FGG08_003655 [Glutinoglossum americanum]|uniref:G-patch domain-containing protein n=1 Tax=Glutinoglossum americanum TaxID=1670608 RepID=A0A9P8I256_9PEZI|nr:hypothetical protein FGG08_003655 [Glutinoglossum americanum]